MWTAAVTAADGTRLLLRQLKPVRLTSDVTKAIHFDSQQKAYDAAKQAADDPSLRVKDPEAVRV